MRILFVGSNGSLSLEPLLHLMRSGHEICAVGMNIGVSPDTIGRRIPVLIENQQSLQALAISNNIPLIDMQSSMSELTRTFRQLRPDIMVVSCFDSKIPDALLQLPIMGGINLHPSLLPAYRGPVPLFWQFRDGLQSLGVTLHRMTGSFDQGPILEQRKVPIPLGCSGAEANRAVAAVMKQLLATGLDRLEKGIHYETAQDDAMASYQPYPDDTDFAVATSWHAKNIFHFMRGTSHWNHLYPCAINNKEYQLLEAISCTETYSPMSITNDRVTFPCASGTLTASFTIQ
jgi:methionyl-tRNA formyltransferase